MPVKPLSRTLMEILDYLDEQKTEVKLLQHNLENLRFECVDLKSTLIFYDQTLGDVARKAKACADAHRAFPCAAE